MIKTIYITDDGAQFEAYMDALDREAELNKVSPLKNAIQEILDSKCILYANNVPELLAKGLLERGIQDWPLTVKRDVPVPPGDVSRNISPTEPPRQES